jgi:hypothetical protein
MRTVTRTSDVRLSGEALPQVPVRATATPDQPGPGRKTSGGPDAEPGFGTTRSARPCGCASRRGRLSRHQRSQSAIRLPVVIGREIPLDGMPDNAAQLLGSGRRFRRPHRRVLPGTVVTGRERPKDLPRARRKTGKDAGPTVGDARVRARHPDDRRAPLSRPAWCPHHICAGARGHDRDGFRAGPSRHCGRNRSQPR